MNGTVDLAEAKAAASKVFDKLRRDHDGTLDRRRGRPWCSFRPRRGGPWCSFRLSRTSLSRELPRHWGPAPPYHRRCNDDTLASRRGYAW